MAKIKTNKTDYAPGETATITADGFTIGSTIELQIQHITDAGADGILGTPDDTLGDNTGAGHEPWYVTDGGTGDLDGIANGSIQTEWYVNPDDSLNETFLATAQQVETGSDGAFGTADDVFIGDPATTSFTDAAGSTNKVYQHWSDEDAAWNNNILNDNKSNYFEGEVIPHVFVYNASNSVPLVNGQSYSFNITYNYYQQNTNAGGFAYITTYNISRTPAPNDATNPYIPPTADGSFTNGGGIQGNFYTVDANITNVSNVSYTGTGTKDAHVTVTFTYTGATTTNGIAEIYYGLYIANPGQIANQGLGTTDGANAWSGGSLQTTVDIGGSGATSIQLAPSAIIAGEISGLKFNDLNGDGTRDANGIDDILGNTDDEVGLAGWTIFLDKDNDGVLDAGETSTVTGAGGAYTFSVTPDADKSDSDNDPYIVREVQQAGWTQTTTNPASILITAADPTETNVNFGNQQQKPSLTIDKVFINVTGGNGNDKADAVGDVLNYTVQVTNTGNITLTDVTVKDPLTGQDISGVTLGVGESKTYDTSYTLTQADLDTKGGGDGDIDNTATADSKETAPVDDSEVVPLVYDPKLAIDKVFINVTGGNGNDKADAVGDVLNYTVQVTNTGNITLTDVTVKDPLTGQDISGVTLGVGESKTYDTSYTLTQADLDTKGGGDGDIDNTATADSKETAPVDDSEVVPLVYDPKLAIDKVTVYETQKGDGLTGVIAGHAIGWEYTVTNTGNVSLDIKVADNQGVVPVGVDTNFDGFNDGDINTDSLLNPNETWTFTASGTAVAGNYNNIGTVSGSIDGKVVATDTDDSSYFGIADVGQIAPTGTTVQQYINGTAQDFSDYYAGQGGVVQYGVKGDLINNTNPGVFFYYTGLSNTIKGVDGSDADNKADAMTVFIDQSDNSNDVGAFGVVKNNVMLFKVNDNNGNHIIDSGDTATQVQLNSNQITLSDGDVTVNFTPDKVGSLYVISVKYDTNTVVKTDLHNTSPTVKYTFNTDVGKDGAIEETDSKGITLAPKKAALMLDGDAAHDGHAPVLQTAELQHVVDQAIDFWAQHGADSVDLSLLRETQVKIADLGGTQLGLTDAANGVTIDDDAAGYGWWTGDGEINLHMVDLLSTVTHEFGHVLGYDHDVMDASLAVGELELPEFNTQIELVGVQAHQVVGFV